MSAGQGSDPEARDAERLAAALDRGRSPDTVDDPTLARDLHIIETMRVFGPDPALDPTPDAKARARARLRAAMATPAAPPAPAESTAPIAAGPIAAGPRASRGDGTATSVTAEFQRIVADETARDDAAADAPVPAVTAPDVTAPRSRRSRHSLPSRPSGRSGSSARPAPRGLRRRVAAVAVASLAALVALAVGGDLASRGSLPGDALYSIKRVAENVGVALTFDEQARAQRHLELATTRVDEVERLVARNGAGDLDAAVVEDVISDFDAATGEGTRALLAAQDASGPAMLGDLQAWASDQAARLSVLRSALPEPALGGLDGSLALLDRLVGRTEALEARSDCAEVTSSVVDDLGPLAAEGSCTPRPAGDADGTGTTGPTGTGDGGTGDGGTAPSTGGDESTDPTTDGTPTTGPEGDGPLDVLPLPDGDLPASTTPGNDSGDIAVPLPLVPPIQLPPLLPGLPGVTIG